MKVTKFTQLTGMRLTPEEMAGMFRIYGGCSRTLSDEEFCAMWKAGDFRALLDVVAKERKLTEEAYCKALENLKTTRRECGQKGIEQAEFLLVKAEQYRDAEMRERAVVLVGERDVTFMKKLLKLPLWDEDLDYIANNKKAKRHEQKRHEEEGVQHAEEDKKAV